MPKFECPACGQRIFHDADIIGHHVCCPTCGSHFQVTEYILPDGPPPLPPIQRTSSAAKEAITDLKANDLIWPSPATVNNLAETFGMNSFEGGAWLQCSLAVANFALATETLWADTATRGARSGVTDSSALERIWRSTLKKAEDMLFVEFGSFRSLGVTILTSEYVLVPSERRQMQTSIAPQVLNELIPIDMAMGILMGKRSLEYQADFRENSSSPMRGPIGFAATRLCCHLEGVEPPPSMACTSAAELGVGGEGRFGAAVFYFTDMFSLHRETFGL